MKSELVGVLEFLGPDSSYVRMEDDLGERLRLYRKGKGMSQKTLAEELGIAVNTLMKIEAGGHRIMPSTYERIRQLTRKGNAGFFINNHLQDSERTSIAEI